MLGQKQRKPASSCKDIPEGSQSGEYWIHPKGSRLLAQVYCDMAQRNCSCDSTGGWVRIANLDMTDPNQNCPAGFRLVNRTEPPLRTCGRSVCGLVSTTFPTHGIEYSRVCGRVVGYQFGNPDAFEPYVRRLKTTINSCYVDGIILTHGQSPRQHIWTFAVGIDEAETRGYFNSCPCMNLYTTRLPPFIGQDYFCDSGDTLDDRQPGKSVFFPTNPLWDGQGCGGNDTCCEFNNPPWFCKQLPQPTTDDIELRLCMVTQQNNWEDSPIEIVEIYIK